MNQFMRRFTLLAVALCLCVAVLAPCAGAVAAQSGGAARAKRALVISLDGLDARYLQRRDEYGLKIPTLRRLIDEGAWAGRGVASVYPSVTYPAHTTMVTGTTPRRHGIDANELFEWPAPAIGAWHWFARDIRVDTLWGAATRAGLKSGMVSWPVATGAGDWNVPEVWRRNTNPGDSLPQTLAEVSANARPRGLVEEISGRDPQLFRGVTKDEGDDMRTRFAEYVIAEKRPEVMLVHLFDLDHFQHSFGPFTPEAFAILEKSDAYVARLLDAAVRAGTLSETAVFIVSDHGFLPITEQINPNVILERAGLLKVGEGSDAQGRTLPVVTDWRVLAYPTSGSCVVVLRDPKDAGAYRKALEAFRAYAEGGAMSKVNGSPFLRVIYAEHLSKMGATPRAAFMLEAADGYVFSKTLTGGEAITATKDRGTHGYLPSHADYRASFIASGAGVARRGDLGALNMLDIGPTVARTLGLTLRNADGRPLKLR